MKKKRKVLTNIHRQSGIKSNYLADVMRSAIYPGKRVSKTGQIYWETRKNRTDLNPKKRI
jgi:hypothetical protein